MNQQEIDRISAFIKEVNQLPDEILTSDEADAFIDENLNQEYTQKVYDNQKQLFGKVQDVKIRLLAYFRAISGETSAYIELIGEITFKTKGYILNTIHLKNNEAWIEDKTKLLNILKMAKTIELNFSITSDNLKKVINILKDLSGIDKKAMFKFFVSFIL